MLEEAREKGRRFVGLGSRIRIQELIEIRYVHLVAGGAIALIAPFTSLTLVIPSASVLLHQAARRAVLRSDRRAQAPTHLHAAGHQERRQTSENQESDVGESRHCRGPYRPSELR